VILRLLLVWLINTVALIAVAYLMPSISVSSFESALLAALVLGLVNAVVRPVLVLLTLPVTILTLGLFIFVLNGLLFWMVGEWLEGFNVAGFWAGVFGAIVFSLVSRRSRRSSTRLTHPDKVIIMPYLGYGTAQRLTVCGRVLEDEGFTPAADSDSRWRNLVRFWKRLESDEVPGARLRASFLGRQTEGVTDGEGYFRLAIARGRLGRGRQRLIWVDGLPGGARRGEVWFFEARALQRDQRHRRHHRGEPCRRQDEMILTAALTNARTRAFPA
jgi:putative membrane protein